MRALRQAGAHNSTCRTLPPTAWALHVAGGPTWPPLESAREWFVPHATRAKWMPLGILRMRGFPALPSCSPMPARQTACSCYALQISSNMPGSVCGDPLLRADAELPFEGIVTQGALLQSHYCSRCRSKGWHAITLCHRTILSVFLSTEACTPSCPYSLLPHAAKLPLSMTASMWLSPHAMQCAVCASKPATLTGVWEVLWPLTPSCPSLFAPEVYSSPSPAQAWAQSSNSRLGREVLSMH